jgi:Uma2 family endonuclease
MIICDLNKFNKNETQYEGIPSIVIEVLSPATAKKDQFVKMDLYTRIGIPEYWIVSPTYKDIQVFKSNQEGEGLRYSSILKTDIFPGLEINIPNVFKIKKRTDR